MNWNELEVGTVVILPKSQAVREFTVQSIDGEYVWLEACAIRAGKILRGHKFPEPIEVKEPIQ